MQPHHSAVLKSLKMLMNIAMDYSHDFENEYNITWDDDCGYGDFSLEKSSVSVSVDIDGLTNNASDELEDAYKKAR